jgi:hypothetical protein
MTFKDAHRTLAKFTLVCYLLLMGAATFGGFLFAIGCAEPETEQEDTEL